MVDDVRDPAQPPGTHYILAVQDRQSGAEPAGGATCRARHADLAPGRAVGAHRLRPHAQRELASRLGIDRSDIVKIVDDLALAGLVDRARDTGDRRRVTVTPTSAGRAVFAELQDEALSVQKTLLAPLTARERVQLAALLSRVHAHVHGGPEESKPGH
ncbi:MarR family winged helix-turn-helix transcriptional regulator [Streptomyces sp. NPDC102437]|uniref:MarR family winged helix-turn-helix transcriptional regulator n=1 Tax=Streptomyces sp. NPDC102437 TaxID=3366175 RepID=UPI0037FFAABA